MGNVHPNQKRQMSITQDFAILAPVPEMHLKSGEETCDREQKVAFGSQAWELFREVDKLRNGDDVEVFIYASQAKKAILEVTWHGVYIGHKDSRNGRYPGDKKFRPSSSASDSPTWAVYWEVRDLKELPEADCIQIVSLRGFRKKSNYQSFIPDKPLLIEYP